MRAICVGLLSPFAAICLWSNVVAAMAFQIGPVEDGYFILGVGPIVAGDRVRLVTAIDSIPADKQTYGLTLNSPGGEIIEAEKMAATIRSAGLRVAVPSGAVCASACFLLFAAGTEKLAALDARIGVHSVSVNSTETLATMGFTTAFARDASAYGVPASIIGRIVTTAPGQIAWLSVPELVSMGTTITPPTDITAPPPSPKTMPPQPAASNTPVATASQAPVMPSGAFQQGADDRRSWELWIGSLSQDARAGADYWAGQRSLKSPGFCAIPTGQQPTDPASWMAGCGSAQLRLNRIDKRRKLEPGYRAGWNSL